MKNENTSAWGDHGPVSSLTDWSGVKKRLLAAVWLLLLVWVQAAAAATVDAPHNETNGVTCASCHSYSLWWQYSPSSQSGLGHGGIANAVCASCHYDGSSAHYVMGHSTADFPSAYWEGAWVINCIDCHDPHFQAQFISVVPPDRDDPVSNPGAYPAGFYLATGDIDTTSTIFAAENPSAPYIYVDSANNQTTFAYVITTDPDPGNPERDEVDAGWVAPADWANKNFQGRGAILSDGKFSNANTFLITATTIDPLSSCAIPNPDPAFTDYIINPDCTGTVTGTISVRGRFVPEPAINDAYSFGIFYGQLIKDKVVDLDGIEQPVKFWNPKGGDPSSGNGGFVDRVSYTVVADPQTTPLDPPTGICQVCHTKVQRFLNDGVLPSGLDTHVTKSFVCSGCHYHNVGFQGVGGGHDANSFSWAGNCAICHAPAGTAGIDIVNDLHNGATTCAACHLFADGGGNPQPGKAPNGVDGTAAGGKNDTSTCLTCHLTEPDPDLTGGAIHHISANNYAANGLCTTCHANAAGKLAADHRTMIADSTLNCATAACHGVNLGLASGAPVDGSDPRIHDACTTCHNLDGSLVDPNLPENELVTAMPDPNSPPFTNGGGDCVVCHTTYTLDSHTHTHAVSYDPAGALGDGDTSQPVPVGPKGCGTVDCHNGNNADGNGTAFDSWTDILSEHQGSCNTCHGSARTTGVNAPYASIAEVISNASVITCDTCHDDKTPAVEHGGHDALTFGWSGVCIDCHANPAETIATETAVVGYVHHKGCTLCHQTSGGGYGTTVQGTDGDARLGATGNADYVSATCITCHPATPYNLTFIHHVKNGTIAYEPAAECATCHNAAQGHAGDHTALVEAVAACTGCHAATAGSADNVPVDGVAGNKVHDACVSCHRIVVDGANNPVDLIDPAGSPLVTTMNNSDGAAATNNGGGNCAACHTAYFTAHLHNHASTVTKSPSCTTAGCHDAIGSGLARAADSAPFVGSGQIHATCATCHASANGALLTAAKGDANVNNGNGGACVDCHSATWAVIHTSAPAVTHTNYVTSLSSTCAASCHDAVAGGSQARNAISTPYISGTEVHAGASCETCHQASGSLLSGGNLADTVTRGNCEGCHTATTGTWSTLHAAAAVNHGASYVTADSNCTTSSCHDGGSTGVARGTSASPYIGLNDVHATLLCATCHNPDGTMRSAAKGTAIAGGADCSDCHAGGWAAIHSAANGVSHQSLVTSSDPNCNDCHNATADSDATDAPEAVISPFTGTGEVHAAGCTLCHAATGALISPAPAKAPLLGASGGNCSECHAAYFTNHAHHNTATNAVSYNAAVDTSQPSAAGCAECHQDASGDNTGLNNWAGILYEHDVRDDNQDGNGACVNCHSYAGDKSAPAGDVATAIVSATPATCASCHTDKVPDVGHGGHGTPDAVVVGVRVCTVCHDNNPAAPKEVMADIHNSNCGSCHEPAPPILADPAARPLVVDIVRGGDCLDCHGEPFGHANDTHAKIVFGNDLQGSIGCDGCHDSDPITEHTTIRGWDCSVCHANPCYDQTINDAIHGVTTQVYCTDCHLEQTFPHGLIDHVGYGKVREDLLCAACHNPDHSRDWLVDIHGDGVNSTCGLCHANPAGAGALIAVLENDVNAVDGGFCTECHNSSLVMPGGAFHGIAATDAELRSRHNNLATADGLGITFTNNKIIQKIDEYRCDDCHMQPANTIQARLEEHPGCLTCHNGIAAYEAVIADGKASGGNQQQSCEACHNATINGGGNTNSPSGKAMYQYDGERHHATEYARKGVCDHCHVDSRPVWETTFGVSGPNQLPTQLACRECHVDQAANGFVVNKLTYSPANVYFTSSTSWALSTVSRVQASLHHQVPGSTPIAINNYGVCTSCHSVNVWHAKPTWNRDTNDRSTSNKDDAFDVLREAPGRSIWPTAPGRGDNDPTNNSGIAKFDIFATAADTGGVSKARMFGRYNFGDSSKPYKRTSSESRGKGLFDDYKNNGDNPWIQTLARAPLGFTRVAIPQLTQVNDAENLMSSNPMVPVFPAVATAAVTDYDTVTIVDAGWNVADLGRLRVVAFNREQDAVTMTVTYGSQLVNAPMSWEAAIGVWTYISPAAVTLDGSTVIVTSSHAGGGSDSHAVRDLTTNTVTPGAAQTAQIHVDNAAQNIPAASVNAGFCTDCHDGNLSIEHAVRGKSCSTCHAPCATPPTPLSSVDCYTCHYTGDPIDPRPQPADHPADVMPGHTFLSSAPGSCVSCHAADIAAGIHGSCFLCHDAAYDPANLQPGTHGYGDARLHQVGGNSGCTVCHPSYAADFALAHQHEDHALVTGGASGHCTSCHREADIIGGVHAGNCTLCHAETAADGTLKGAAGGHQVGTASRCIDCHAAYDASFVLGHQHEDHANLIATTSTIPVENCANCHSGDLISDQIIHNSNCEYCHNDTASDGSLRAGSRGDASGHLINSQSGCADCHGPFDNHLHSHTIISLGSADLGQIDSQPCANCHNDNGGDLATWTDILTEHDTTCGLCHNATRSTYNVNDPLQTVQDIITDKIPPVHCLTCHGNKEAPAIHDIDHPLQNRVTATPQCISCHDKDNVGDNDWYINVIHRTGVNRCNVCHLDAAGGGPLREPWETNNAKGGACADCHAAYAVNFATGHQNADHSGLAGSSNCSGCHSGDHVTGVNTHNGSCTRCHTNITDDGTLKLGVNGNGDATGHYLGAQSTCGSCHPEYNLDFYGAHNTADHSGLGSTPGCASCHGANVIGGVDTHHSSCLLCHASLGVDGSLREAPDGNAQLHKLEVPSTCTTCHNTYSPDFDAAGAHKVKDHNTLVAATGPTPTRNCAGCHSGPVVSTTLPDEHHDNCSACHAAGTGELITGSRGDASQHQIGVNSNCQNCHGAFGYFASHIHSHDGAQGVDDLAQSSSQPCSNCHGTLATWTKVISLHKGSCTTCHDATRDINKVAATGTTVQDVIRNHLGTVHCLDCHADKAAPAAHGLIDHQGLGKVTWTPLCAGCHNLSGNADVIYQVHKVGTKNQCGVCHQNPYGVGPLRQPWETDSPAGGECTTCHTFTAMDRHHASDHAQSGDCTFCHTDPWPEWAANYGAFIPNPVPKQLACIKCHVESTGTGLVVYRNTYSPTNVTSFPNGSGNYAVNGAAQVQQSPVHTIVGPKKINVYDYGACLGCHDGTYPNAPQIQVWHAKPIWNKNTHDLSNVVYDNPFDTLRYAPGRSVLNASGTSVVDSRFNLFYNGADTGTQQVRVLGRYNFGNSSQPYEHTNSESRGENLYDNYSSASNNPWYQDRFTQRIAVPCIPQVNDPEGVCNGYDPRVPYYDDIPMPIVADDLYVSKAEWNGTELTVWAYNDYRNNAILTYEYNGSTGNLMTWNDTAGRWEGVYAGPYATPVVISSDVAGSGTVTEHVLDLTATPDIVYVTKAEWDRVSGGTITIWAEHSFNNGTLAYEVDYNGFQGEAMIWNGIDKRYELTVHGVPYAGVDTLASIHAHEPGGASLTVQVDDVSGAPQDVITVIRAAWDANDSGTLVVYANHLLNDGSLTYTVNYNGSTATMSWNQLSRRYAAVMPEVVYNGVLLATVSSADEGGDSTTVHVTDVTGTADHEGLEHVTQTADCSRCHNASLEDPKDVVTDIHKGKCALCHNPTWPNMQAGISRGSCADCHGNPYHTPDILHNQITFGFGEGNACARSCHNPVPLREHLDGAVTGRAYDCTACHASPYFVGIIAAGIAGSAPVYCTDCHTEQTFPHGNRNHAIRNMANCLSCHDGIDPVADIHLTTGSGNDCDLCHGSAAPAVVNTIAAQGGDCASCHAERYAHQTVGAHNISAAGASCGTCHAAATFAQVVDLHRDTCATCHASTDAIVKGVIATGGAVDCADCHQSGIDHHQNPAAQAGDCGYCHTDPRPDWISSHGTITPSPMPKQLACVKCHVEAAGTGLVVYKNTYTPVNVSGFPNGSTSWGVTGDASVQQTPIHTISGAAKINVYDYGICLGCHDGNTPGAAAIQVWHARPTHPDSSSAYDNPFDVFRNAPGRSYYANNNTAPTSSSDAAANDRRFNIFASSTGTGGPSQIRIAIQEYYKNTSSESRGKRFYDNYRSTSRNPWYGSIWSQRVTIPRINAVNNQQGLLSSNPQVPYFSDITPPVVGGSGGDQVIITEALWHETDHLAHTGDLKVSAVNSLTATLLVNGQNMTQVGSHWEVTFSGLPYPATITVDSTATAGGSATGPVADRTCYSCIEQGGTVAHSYINNLPAGNCAQCHTGSLMAEHLTRGLSCSNCHKSENPVIQQAIRDGVFNSVTCNTCHGPRTQEHPYDLHAHSVAEVPTDLSQLVPEPCRNCHAVADFAQIEQYTHNQATNGPGSCNTCHLSSRTEVQDTILFNKTMPVECLDCHSDKESPAAHGNAHHVVFNPATDLAQDDSQPCSNCHGSLDAYIDILILHEHDCTLCHSATRDINPVAPGGTTVPEVIAAGIAGATTNCLGCHADKAAPAFHGPNHPLVIAGVRDSKYGGASMTCSTAGCHATNTYAEHLEAGGIAYQKYQEAGNPFQCNWCHQYLPVQAGMTFSDDPAINHAISLGVDGKADVYCTDCHQYDASRLDPYGHGWTVKYSDADYSVPLRHHENTAPALSGQCTICHVDPRLDPYGTGVSLPAPKMMPCRDCHVKSEPYGGSFGTGKFTVYKARTATQVTTGSEIGWDWQFVEPPANTDPIGLTGVSHEWNVQGGMIDSFGICLFCHKMRPYHAKVGPPPEDPDRNVVNPGEDPPNYQGPGRGSLGVFYGDYRKANTYYEGTAQGGEVNKPALEAIRDHDSRPRADISYWAMITYDPQTNPHGNVPEDHIMGVPEYFTVPTFDPPVGGDLVTITQAVFNPATLALNVTATNTTTGSGYQLFAIHAGQSIPMIEGPTGTWNATFTGYTYDISDQIGRVYVISVDPAANYILVDQEVTNPAVGDNFTVLTAAWNGVNVGGELVVELTNTAPGENVYVTYNGQTYPMIESSTHHYIVVIADPTYAGTLAVSSDAGGSLTGVMVTDVTSAAVGGCEIDPNGTYIEAENYTTAGNNWQLASAVAGANGGSYLNAIGNNTSTPPGIHTTYVVNFPQAGTYNIAFRGYDNANGGDNSLWYGLNGIMVGNITTPGSNTNWNWSNTPHNSGPNPAALTIGSAGEHTISVWARENNFKFDGFYLKLSDPTLPTGAIPAGMLMDPSSCAGGGGGSTSFADQVDDFTAMTTGPGGRPTFGNWTGVWDGSSLATPWTAWCGQTPSLSTSVGPSVDYDGGSDCASDVYLYLEGSAVSATNGVGVGTGSTQTLESNAQLDASRYIFTFSFYYNMNFNNYSDGTLTVEGWDGFAWVPVATVASGDRHTSSQWSKSPDYNLGSFTNTNFKIRVKFVLGSRSAYYYDLGLDHLVVTGATR